MDGVLLNPPYSCGAQALVAFTERAGERSNQRGTLSAEQQSKFAGKFMEDVEADQSETIDDVVAKMEAALGESPSESSEGKEEDTKEAKPSTDGW